MTTNTEETDLLYLRLNSRWHVLIDGRLLPVVSGGADDDDDKPPDDTGGDDDDDDDKPDPNEKNISQAELTRIAAKEKREGKKSGRKDLLKDLGVETEEELKNLLKGKTPPKGKDSEEIETLRSDHAAATARAEKAERAVAEATLRGKIVDALIDKGLTAKAARKASRLIEVDAEAEDDEITDAVEDLKEEMPQLFGSKEDDTEDDKGADAGGRQQQRERGSDAGPPPRKKGTKEPSAADKADARLRQMRPKHFAESSKTT